MPLVELADVFKLSVTKLALRWDDNFIGVTVSVNAQASSPANDLKLVDGTLDKRRICAVGECFKVGVDHIGYPVWIGYNDLKSLILAKIRELVKHLLCSFEI